MDMRRLPRPGGTLTIDLGDVSVPPPVPTAPPVSPKVWRRLRVAAVLLLALFTAVGATPGPAHLNAVLWTRQLSLAGFTLGPDRLIMSDPGSRTVTGRDLATGEVRWQARLPVPAQYLTPAAPGLTALAVRNVDVEENGAVSETDVTLLITDSGGVLSRIPGNLVTAARTDSLVLVWTGAQSVTLGCPPDVAVCSDIAGFDLVTQRQVWRRALPGRPVSSVPEAPAPLTRFVMTRSGLVEVRDPTTGDLVDTLTLPAAVVDAGSTPQLILVGDTLVTAVRRGTLAELTASAVGPLGHDWVATLPVGATVDERTARFYLAGCGSLLCLHADGADALFDPRTGVLRGQVGYQVIGQVGDTLLAAPPAEQPGTPQSRRTVHLLRAGDGQTVATWADTAAVPWSDSQGWALLARQGSAGTMFTAIDGHGGQRQLGTVAGGDLSCQAAGVTLACSDPGGQLRTWRLPGM